MSGHNPHGHLSQPVNSTSWNHLQVPYTRQPQLAHMSSDRTLRSSPLIWPNTNPADAFYNYMALTAAAAVANSNPKNSTLDINPLLPFVRTTPTNAMPFNSVDLSLSSSSTSNVTSNLNRNTLTPSPRNPISPGSGSTTSNRFSKITGSDGGDDSTNNGTNKMDTNRQKMPPIIARDSSILNSDLSNFRSNGGNDMSKQRTEPMELVKDQPNTMNPFESESLSQSVHLQQLLGLEQPPPPLPLPLPPSSVSTSITPNLNDLSKSLLSIFNNTSPTKSLLMSPKTTTNFLPRQSNDPTTTTTLSSTTSTPSSKNCLNTSNDDSLDSQSTSCNGDNDSNTKSQNTRYRRRKQQKTVRMPNDFQAADPLPGHLDGEKNNLKRNEHNKIDPNNSNGIGFSTFHSDAASILPVASATAAAAVAAALVPNIINCAGVSQPPQTQSMDLSHHCASQELYENGLVNYSKPSNLDLPPHGNIVGADSHNTTKEPNFIPTDEINSLNFFGAMNFGHLRGTNLTNDIATFPNTDDLVKKVEELVKCNEQNGFGNNDFEPMELIKSHANKLVSDAYGNNSRLSNGLAVSMKITNNMEHIGPSHSVGGGIKHNGNGITGTMIANSTEKIENKLHEINHTNDAAKITTEPLLSVTNPYHNGELEANTSNGNSENRQQNNIDAPIDAMHPLNSSDIVPSPQFAGISTVNMMYQKMSNKITEQTNLSGNFAPHQTANTPQQNHTSSFNSNELAKDASLSAASSSESSSNPSSSSSTSSSSSSTRNQTTTTTTTTVTAKKKANNRCNGKMNKSTATKSNNQRNAKSKEKSEKKSDIIEKKKTKSADEQSTTAAAVTVSAIATTHMATTATGTSTEVLNKFRGPYVHVDRNGTLEVINAPLNEEIAEKQSKFKKNFIGQRTADRNKVRGLHVSTLSNKYDAITTDISWMCVFCKLGPHKYGLGDLFGPFILSTESEDFQLTQIDPNDDIFRSQSRINQMAYSQNVTAVAAKSMSKSGTTGNAAVKKKRKLNQTEHETSASNLTTSIENTAQNTAVIDIFYGMTRASDCSYEVWAHEDCIVWASGVHIIGARVVGLETAVWGSVRHQCGICKQYGAMLSCLQRSCSDEVHVPCAKRCDWSLDEHSFQGRCSKHSLATNQHHDQSIK